MRLNFTFSWPQETYEVFGQMKMGPGQACPEDLVDKTARVKCADGDVLEVPAEALALSFRARKDLLEKGCEEEFAVPCRGGMVLQRSSRVMKSLHDGLRGIILFSLRSACVA